MAEGTPRQVTIFDVARLAGVSHQTVSRVLNDLPNVRPATKARVQDAIKKLRYVPSPAARALVTRRSRTIGLVTTGGTEFGPSSTVLYFNAAARDARWSVFTANMVDGDPAAVRSAVEAFLRQNVEGIGVISGHQGVTDAVLAMELTVPLIILRSTPHPGLMTVGADQYGAARTAVRHLIDLGHRTISHLAGPPDSADARERERGWRDELAAHDLAANVLGVGDWTPAAGYSLGARFDAEHFSAVFAANDQMALGLMHALAGKGLVVPDDVSIVGFDDIPESAHFSPPLTTLRQDFRRLGHDMLTMLLTRIDGSEPEPIEVQQPQLIVRSSTREPSRVDLSTRS